MHRVQRNTYVGQPGEVARVATEIHGGGRVRLTLDGQNLGNARTFPLPGSPGQQRNLRIDLAGPLGASCGVGISTVDGSTDGDFLLCQAFNPLPSSNYTFQVAAAAGVAAFGALKGFAAPAAAVKGKKSRKKTGKARSRTTKKGRK